jgi:aspartate carbamoyltransferase regulatory subunit
MIANDIPLRCKNKHCPTVSDARYLSDSIWFVREDEQNDRERLKCPACEEIGTEVLR